MGRHDPRQLVVDEQAIGPQIRLQIGELAPIHRQRHVRIRHHRTMAGEMLGDRRHARLAHAGEVRGRQRRDRLRMAVKGAIADDLAHAIIQIDARREAEIDPGGAQFARHEPPDRVGQAQGVAAVLVEPPAEQARRGQPREPVAEALYAAALVVDPRSAVAECAESEWPP